MLKRRINFQSVSLDFSGGVPMEFLFYNFVGAISLFRPQNIQSDGARNHVRKLDSRAVCLLGREHDFEGKNFSVEIAAAGNPPELQFQFPVLAFSSPFKNDEDFFPDFPFFRQETSSGAQGRISSPKNTDLPPGFSALAFE